MASTRSLTVPGRKIDSRKDLSLKAVRRACEEEVAAQKDFPNFSIKHIGRRSHLLGGPQARTLGNKKANACYLAIIAEFRDRYVPNRAIVAVPSKEQWIHLVRDPVARRHVETVLAQNEALRVSMGAFDMKCLGPLRLASQGHGEMPVLDNPVFPTLLPSEADALRRSIDPRSLETVGLRRGDRGRIVDADGHTIHSAGFATAIEKIIGFLPTA